MRLDLLPLLLFPCAAVLAAILAWQLRLRNKPLATVSLLLSIVAAALMLLELQARAARATIRVDLLVTLPALAVSMFAVGLAARRRSGGAALLLAAAGGLGLAWFLAATATTTFTAWRLTGVFDRSTLLYWQETIRCQDHLERRFGTLASRDRPCRGHFLAEGSLGGLRFTRLILTDKDELYLLFSRQSGLEESWGFPEDSPLARVGSGPGLGLSGPCIDAARCREVEVRPAAGGGCEAVMRFAREPETRLRLRPAGPLRRCAAAAAEPVRSIGTFAGLFVGSGRQPLKQLVQLWLWELGNGETRALLLAAEGYSGNRTEFNFVRPFCGRRTAPGQWELETCESPRRGPMQRLRVALLGEGVALSGEAIRFRFPGDSTLPRGELVSHPKIALVPLYDAARFGSYFDNVFNLVAIPWVVP